MVDRLETMAVTKRLQNTIATTNYFCVDAKGRIAGAAHLSVGIADFLRKLCLHAEIAMLDVRNRRERRGGAVPDHPTALDQIVAIGDANQRVDILVDHQDRQALRLEPRKTLPDLGTNQRRQALGRLVEDQE